jgi:NAD(P)-dependent dehydrogenase (short-subunit alcohol dehydrogenase family)
MKRSSQPEVVVITGASAGVGRAVVREFALHGADVALEEILWHELEEIGAGAARIADANAEIIRRVAEAPHRHVQVVVDSDGVELLMVGDVETWAAAGHKGDVALRISSKGVEISKVELERVQPDRLDG